MNVTNMMLRLAGRLADGFQNPLARLGFRTASAARQQRMNDLRRQILRRMLARQTQEDWLEPPRRPSLTGEAGTSRNALAE